MRSIVECPLVDMRIPYLLLLHSPAAVITLPPALSRDPPFSPSEPPALSISFIRSFPPYSFLPSFLPACEKRSYLKHAIRKEKKRKSAIHRRDRRGGKNSGDTEMLDAIGRKSSTNVASRNTPSNFDFYFETFISLSGRYYVQVSDYVILYIRGLLLYNIKICACRLLLRAVQLAQM